ncbi:MAG: hypothetical protein VYA53_00480 [Acidobacteriota bacterium]|nr:hypothetical protein [Acidobacteriota bacterium]
MKGNTMAWIFFLTILLTPWAFGGPHPGSVQQRSPDGNISDDPTVASCTQFLAPMRNVNGQMVGQEECLMQDHGIVEPTRQYRRIDMGVTGTLSGWIVKQGSRQNYFTSGPDFIFTQFGNHSERFHGILRYEAAKGTAVILTYPENGWNGKLFVLVHGRSGSFLRGTMKPWNEYFDPENPFDHNKYEQAMLAKGYAVARTRRNADGFAIGDYSVILDDGTVWPDQNINMVPELILDEVRLVGNFLKKQLGQKPTRNYWYGHSSGGYSGLALNYLIQSNPDINKNADGTETISGFINDDPGGGMFLPILIEDGRDILYRAPESKTQFIKSFSIVHQAYPLVYSNIVPGEMDLENLPEGISPVALNNKRKMARLMIDKGINNFRMYEVRGVSHSGGERYVDGKNGDIEILDLSRLMDGMIDLLDNWVEKNIEPPVTKSDDPSVGPSAPAISLPEVACPLGKYFPFPQFRGVQGAGSTGFAPYDGTNLEPLNGQLQFVDMNNNGRRDTRETVTEAWHRMGLLNLDKTFSRNIYIECIQKTATRLQREGLITERIKNSYIEDAREALLPE